MFRIPACDSSVAWVVAKSEICRFMSSTLISPRASCSWSFTVSSTRGLVFCGLVIVKSCARGMRWLRRAPDRGSTVRACVLLKQIDVASGHIAGHRRHARAVGTPCQQRDVPPSLRNGDGLVDALGRQLGGAKGESLFVRHACALSADLVLLWQPQPPGTSRPD